MPADKIASREWPGRLLKHYERKAASSQP